MVKKMKAIAIVALMLFGVVALTACTPEEDEIVAKGTFYSLQEAYDKELLTIDDLRSIAHYQSAGEDEPNFVPTPMNPEVLSSETIEAIKKTYLVALRLATHQDGTFMFPNATIDDVNFFGYYGTYGNAVAIKISDEFSGNAGVVLELVVVGVTFTYSGVPVAIWKSI